MTERELIFIAILLVNLVLMFFAFKLINKLSDEGKISKGKKTYLMIISFLMPIIGWMRVKYESKKF
jgi:Na+-driven multidrug efflux pump